MASLSLGRGGSPTLITQFIWSTRKPFTNCHERKKTCKETTGIARATHKNIWLVVSNMFFFHILCFFHPN